MAEFVGYGLLVAFLLFVLYKVLYKKDFSKGGSGSGGSAKKRER